MNERARTTRERATRSVKARTAGKLPATPSQADRNGVQAKRQLDRSASVGSKTYAFRLGDDVPIALARAAKDAASAGPVAGRQLRRLQRVARNQGGLTNAQQLFLAGLVDTENALAVSRIALSAGATVEFSFASIRAGLPRVNQLARRPKPAARPPASPTRARARVDRAGGTPDPPAVAPGGELPMGAPPPLVASTAEVITPDEMYRTLTAWTAFREGVHENRLLQHGNATRAMVQVIDRDGQRVAVAFGRNNGTLHAEEDALRRLEPQLAKIKDRLNGGSMVVVVNQHVCDDRCVPALTKVAKDYELQEVASHVYVREKIVGTGEARPRATFRGQTNPSAEGLELRRVSKTLYSAPPKPTPPLPPPPAGTSTKPGVTVGEPPVPKVTPSPTAAPETLPKLPPAGEPSLHVPRPPKPHIYVPHVEPPSPSVLRRLFRSLWEFARNVVPPVLIALQVLLEVVNAVDAYAMAAGGLSGQGFIFSDVIARARGIVADLEARLASYQQLDDELTHVSTLAAFGSPEAIAELRKLAPVMGPALHNRFIEAQERKRQLIELRTEANEKEKLAAKLLASRDVALVTGMAGTFPQAQMLAAQQDMIKIRALADDAIKRLDAIIELLQRDLEVLIAYWASAPEPADKPTAKVER